LREVITFVYEEVAEYISNFFSNTEIKIKIVVEHKCPNLVLEGCCPAEFSSNLPHHNSLEVSGID